MIDYDLLVSKIALSGQALVEKPTVSLLDIYLSYFLLLWQLLSDVDNYVSQTVNIYR